MTRTTLLALAIATGLACDDGGATTTDTGPEPTGDAGPAIDATAPETDAGPAPDPGLFAIDDLSYVGAFRVSDQEHGDSSSNYAVGTLAYHAGRHSLYLAGHAHHNAIAEFAIPTLGTSETVEELPLVEEPLQDFRSLLGASPNGNPDGMDKITGLYVSDGHLIVQANRWYDAAGSASDTTLLVVDGELDGTVIGYFELEGRARSAGFIAPVPDEWQEALGGPALAGWASNYSIIGRYSVGPTLYAFDPGDLTGQADDANAEGVIAARAWMDYPHGGGEFLAPDALEVQCDITDDVTSCEPDAAASPLWNFLSKAMYGFIVPGTRTYVVVGSTGGTETGIGYKIRQDDDNLCGGYCARGAADYSNYYWLFDLDEVLEAESPSDPQPYAYGPWSIPFDEGGRHRIVGGTWDPEGRTLYLALDGAGQVGDYDRPPLIVAYQL